MKLLIAGVSRSYGIGKESKKPYEILICHALEPIESGTFGGMTVEATGFREVELRLTSPDVVKQFTGAKLPGYFECVVDMKMERGEYRSSLSSIVMPVAKAA